MSCSPEYDQVCAFTPRGWRTFRNICYARAAFPALVSYRKGACRYY